MTIQRIDSFSGTAEVGTTVRPFRYDADARELAIGDLDADQAVMLLRAIGRGDATVAAGIASGHDEVVMAAAAGAAASRDEAPTSSSERVKVGGADHGKPAAPAKDEKPTAPAKDEKPTEKPAAPAKDEKPKAASKASSKTEKTKAPAKKRGSSKKANVRDDMDVAGDPEATETPPVEAEAEKPAAKGSQGAQDAPKDEPKAEAPADDGELPEELTGAKKLRDVVSYFYDSGVTDPEEIVSRCVAVKDGVKVLARIKNVEDRVRRALDVLGLAG